MKKQSDIFVEGEGDAWFLRNHGTVHKKDWSSDPIVKSLVSYFDLANSREGERGELLEIGCGEGKRLQYIQKRFGLKCFGIDPSAKAVDLANEVGVRASKGTADYLGYSKSKFDVVVFGFCLYLCDRADLFQISAEADRVLKPDGWLIIQDFFFPYSVAREYSHCAGVYSFKMDYRKLFEWHPHYTCVSHHISSHDGVAFTDDRDQWVATSVIRKKSDDE